MPDISLPIISTLLHPPITALRRELIVGTFSGGGDLTRVRGPLQVDAYGLSWDFITVPAEFGITYGTPNIYEERMLQLSAMHLSTDGHEFISEYHGFSVEGIYWQWDNALPHRIHYEIQVGVECAFFWLVV